MTRKIILFFITLQALLLSSYTFTANVTTPKAQTNTPATTTPDEQEAKIQEAQRQEFIKLMEAEFKKLAEEELKKAKESASNIFEALLTEDLETIKKFIKDVNKINDKGQTTISYALVNLTPENKFKIVKYLIDNGANINQETAFSAVFDSTDIFKLVLDRAPKGSIDINKPDKNGNTLLSQACTFYANLETVKLLLEKGASVNSINMYGNTPLNRTARLLLYAPIDIKANIFSRISKNIESKAIELMEILVKNDNKRDTINKANNDGRTPLHFLIGNFKLIEEIMSSDQHEKVDKENIEQSTEAKKKLHKKVKDLLKKHLAYIGLDIYDPVLLEKRLNSIKLLLDNGAKASIDKPDKNGITPLHLACQHNNLELIKLLMKDAPKDLINKTDNKGFTPFYYACAGSKKRNNIDMIKFLLDSNPNVNIDLKSYSAATIRNNDNAKKYIQEYLKKNNKKIPE